MKQKIRRTKPGMSLKIREEVKKKFDEGFLAVSKYPQWVANILPFLKKDGKVRICMNYRYLNKESPKDDFPLHHIDVLVDNITQLSVFYFMDGFSGHDQIKMTLADMEKTTSITPWGTLCYKVIPLGLKNVEATYQRLTVNLFHDMIHKEIEVNIDDMIAKSQKEEDYMVNLQKLFDRLRNFKLRLHSTKYIIGVRFDMLLGFIVCKRRTEVDP